MEEEPLGGVYRAMSFDLGKARGGLELGSGLGNISTCLAVMFLHSHLLLAAVKASMGAGWTFGRTLPGFSCVVTIKDLFLPLMQLQKPSAGRNAKARWGL